MVRSFVELWECAVCHVLSVRQWHQSNWRTHNITDDEGQPVMDDDDDDCLQAETLMDLPKEAAIGLPKVTCLGRVDPKHTTIAVHSNDTLEPITCIQTAHGCSYSALPAPHRVILTAHTRIPSRWIMSWADQIEAFDVPCFRRGKLLRRRLSVIMILKALQWSLNFGLQFIPLIRVERIRFLECQSCRCQSVETCSYFSVARS